MKTVHLFSFLLLLSSLVQAQDIIMKTNQAEVSAKVTEITTDEVKFKYFNRLDGPTYTLKKSEIFVIIYKDGTREKFSPPPVETRNGSAASAYTDPPVAPPVQPAPVSTAPAYAPTLAAAGIRRGWTGSFGYTTPLQGLGNASGITYGGGYFFLGPGRKGGILLDLDVMNFFGEGSPKFGLVSVNGIVRATTTSKFYVGGGLGYSTVSVDLKDRYGSTTTAASGDFGGKAFVGYGILRVNVVSPSLQTGGDGGLLTVGLYTSPFR